jgi:hypothetical protein
VTKAHGPWHCAWWSSWALGAFVACSLFVLCWALGFAWWAFVLVIVGIRCIKELMWRSMLYEKAYRRGRQ